MSGLPPPPPPLHGLGGAIPPPPPPPSGATRDIPYIILPQINIPKPRSKMKTFQWQKIPVNNVVGKSNLWTIIGCLEKKYKMDYEKMDELFSVHHESSSGRFGPDIDGISDGSKKRENVEVNILDGKRSLNVNIFLKQFRMEHEEIVQMLREGRCEKFGAERLRSLLKLLPSQEEIDAINGYGGDIDKLGNAEKFFIRLMKLPNYRMRVEGLLIMEEFNVNMEWIRPSIEAVIQAAKDIQENESLKELLYLILISGNYLNSGNYAGNAAGFKLSSLLKLTEIRANRPGMNLMHYVAQEAEEKNTKLLKFPEEMIYLKDASQVSVETLTTDISNIASKVRAITEQIVVAGTDFQHQMAFFLKEANVEVAELEEDLNDIEMMRQELATFFCEDIKIFKLEECFRILQTFCDRLRKATEENIQRRIQEAKAERKRRSKEPETFQIINATELNDQNIDHKAGKKGSIVDMLLADVRSGFVSRKFNDGNFSLTKVTKVNLGPNDAVSSVTSGVGNGSGVFGHGDYFPDSPTGSSGSSPTPDCPAQRRSRQSYTPGDGESLIDFLMETAHAKADPKKQESDQERYASLRRRRLEKKAKRATLELERERAPSPSVSDMNSPVTTTGASSSSVQMRHHKDSESLINTQHRPKSGIESKAHKPLQRSRSWLDKPSVDKTNSIKQRTDIKDDESDALIKRIKERLSKKDPNNTSSSADTTTTVTKTNTRWRSGITVSENSPTLEPIVEKNPTLDDFINSSQTKALEKTRERTSNRFRSNLDPSELSKVLQDIDSSSGDSKYSKDDGDLTPSVMVSMRKRISSGMGTDIDGVLKTIEDTGRQIDTIGVTGPMKRTPEPTKNNNLLTQPQVAVVAHMTTSNNPSMPSNDQDLKAKRDKRKKRSTLSLDDVKAAMRLSGPERDSKNVKNMNISSTQSNSHINNSSAIKSPHSPSQLTSKVEKIENENKPYIEEGGNNKEIKAAKLAAARKKFRGARFGVSGTSEANSNGRARSNVESDSVDQALKEIACQSNMNRSKSYDEHVAKKGLTGEEEFASNSIMRMNSNSAPDTTAEKQAVLRNSMSRLSVDGRRNGLYIPSDDSDTELKPQDIGTRRSSKSDSPKSFSQMSLKSANASTETLQADIDPHADQNTKNLENLSQKSPLRSTRSDAPFQRDSLAANNTTYEPPPLRRSYSMMERNINTEEDSESPLAAVAKWRMKRAQQRKSVYDNMRETDNSTEIHHHGLAHHSKLEENDIRNEVGSRSSYASSNDRDEGFESASGSMSQRTSMSSNLEVEMYNTPTLSRRTEGQKPKGRVEQKSVINTTRGNNSVISQEEADRKEWTENWTEQTIMANAVNGVNNNEFCNSLSMEGDHNIETLKSNKSSSAVKQRMVTSAKKNEDTPKSVKVKSLPSYMQPTSSSSSKPDKNRLSLTTRNDIVVSPTDFKRNVPSRTSTRDQEIVSPFKRDNIRASMKAENATASFQRGTIARTSIRGPRTPTDQSTSQAKAFLSIPNTGRPRSDSNASISSISSNTSNISAAHSSVSETTRRRLDPTAHAVSPLNPRRPAASTHQPAHSSYPVSPASRSTTISSRAIAPASRAKASALPTNSGFTRTQSMRVTSSRTSTGSDLKHNTPHSDNHRSVTPSLDGRHSTTPFLTDRSTTPSLPERPSSTTFSPSEGSSSRRSSFMAPTASSRAKADEQAPVAPPRTKSLRGATTTSPLTRSASLRVPRNVSGRESPALSDHHKPEHHQSLSTVAEQAADEAREEFYKKPSSLLGRITGIGKVIQIGAKTSPKTRNTILMSQK